MVKQVKTAKKKRAKRFTMVAIMVNYDYEVGRLKGKIAPFEAWYQQQAESLKRFCQDSNLGCAMKSHDRDFKRDKNHVLVHDENGNLIPDAKHYHAILVNYSKKPATLKQWAEALEIHGVHISKVSDIPTLSNISGIAMRDFTAADAALGYLVHATPNARKMLKFQYDPKDVILIRMEQFFGVKTALEARKAYEGICRKEKTTVIEFDNDDFDNYYQFQREEIDKGITIRDLQEQYKKFFGSFYSGYEVAYLRHLEKARQNYLAQLSTQFTYFDRKFSYIHISGVGGTGKSLLAGSLAGLLAGKDMRVHVAATPDKKKTPDLLSTYTDELVSVAHELKPGTFSVEGFESFMDPHVYPTINSRNRDKPYFANNFINANAMPTMDWLYTLFYWSMLVGNGAEVNYQYNAYSDSNDITYFPKSWQQLSREPNEFFYKHWTISGQHAFLNEWWQLIRRIAYIIELTPLSDNAIQATIFKLDSTKPESLIDPSWLDAGGRTFLDEFDLSTHFTEIESFTCANIVDTQIRSELAVDIYTKLVATGLYAPETLPPLMSTDEIKQATGLVKPQLHAVEKKVVAK